KGKRAPARFRFFATELPQREGALALVGTPYRFLVADMIADERLAALGMETAAGRSPEQPGGLNIEGMTAAPDGRLLLGFRNPIVGGRALVVALENPHAVLGGASAKFGAPMLLELGGYGVRSLSWWRGTYLVIGGGIIGLAESRLFRWDGVGDPVHLEKVRVAGLNP